MVCRAKSCSARKASNYFKEDDYVSEKGKAPALVCGEARELLGLSEQYSSEDFNNALNGIFPNSDNFEKAEVANTERENFNDEKAALELLFCPPKSASVGALVDPDSEFRELCARACRAGNAAAMKKAETMIRARVTADGRTQSILAKAVIMSLEHTTSRHVDGEAPDPNWHYHNIVMKSVLVEQPDGSYKVYALDDNEFFIKGSESQKACDGAGLQAMAQIFRDAGEPFVLTKDGFELTRYSKEELKFFSKRGNGVEENLAKKGLTRETSTQGQRETATLVDRNSKEDFPQALLDSSWAEAHEFFTQQQETQNGNSNERNNEQARLSINGSVARAAQRDRYNARAEALGLHSADADEQNSDVAGREPETADGGMLRALSESDLVCDVRSGEMSVHSDVRTVLDDGKSSAHPGMRRLDGKTGKTTADDAIDVAINHFLQSEVFINDRHSLFVFANKAAELDFPAEELDAAIDRKIESGELILGHNGRALVMKQAVDDEIKLKEMYNGGLKIFKSITTNEKVEAGIAKMEADMSARINAKNEKKEGRPLFANEITKEKLTTGQVAMIRAAATSTDQFNVFVGDAGTGKSTGMEALKNIMDAKNIFEECGYTIKGIAPSGGAVIALAKTGIICKTAQHAYTNPRYWDDVDEYTIVLIDESGLADIETMTVIMERVKAKGARLIVVGDHKQHGSVNRGTVMSMLVKEADKAGSLVTLDEMQRAARDNPRMIALHFAARDNPKLAQDMLFEAGKFIGIENEQERLNKVADLYMEMDAETRKEGWVLTGQNVNRVKINLAIQERMALPGGVMLQSLEVLKMSGEQARMLANYDVGNRIKFHQAQDEWAAGTVLKVLEKLPSSLRVEDSEGRVHELHPKTFNSSVSIAAAEEVKVAVGERLRFTAACKEEGNEHINGDRGTVTRIEDGRMFVKLDRTEKEVSFSLNDGEEMELRLAYASTGHAAQGVTADPPVIKYECHDDPTSNRKSAYVDPTRAVNDFIVITDAITYRQYEEQRDRSMRKADKATTDEVLYKKTKEERDEEKAAIEYEAFISPKFLSSEKDEDGRKHIQRIDIPKDASPEIVAELLATAERQYGRELFVKGPKVLQKQVATVAGEREMVIKFDDKVMEQTRKHYAKLTREGREQGAMKQEAVKQPEKLPEPRQQPVPEQQPAKVEVAPVEKPATDLEPLPEPVRERTPEEDEEEQQQHR